MTKDRLNQKKKTYFLIGTLCSLLVLLGFFVYWFNTATWHHTLGQSPLAGHLEVVILLVVITLIVIGGVFGVARLWKDQPKSFVYDIGLRLVAMGYSISILSGLADYIGIGAHHKLPYFGPIQTTGVFLGEVVIAISFFLMLPWSKHAK